jgi:hypothetical protein
MTHRQKRIFFNWLKKYNALEKYKHNRFVFMREYRRHGWTRPYKYAYMEAFDALSLAFSWINTPEGQSYWNYLDEVWTKEFRRVMGRML